MRRSKRDFAHRFILKCTSQFPMLHTFFFERLFMRTSPPSLIWLSQKSCKNSCSTFCYSSLHCSAKNDNTTSFNFELIRTQAYPSYAPLTIRLLSKRIQRTSSSCPSKTRKQAPHSISHSLEKHINKFCEKINHTSK